MAVVSMPFRAGTPFLPLDGVPVYDRLNCINALSGWNSISTGDDFFGKRSRGCFVSMPFRAGTPFLRYPFESLGFMRFLEPVFAGIYQNILTMAIFRVC